MLMAIPLLKQQTLHGRPTAPSSHQEMMRERLMSGERRKKRLFVQQH